MFITKKHIFIVYQKSQIMIKLLKQQTFLKKKYISLIRIKFKSITLYNK